jgi:hypothetical protein
VKVTVSSTGAVEHIAAVWRLAKSGGMAGAPIALIEYPVDHGVVGHKPEFISVIEVVPFNPPPPTATASILLIADGVEKTRRTWSLFANTMSGINSSAPAPVALVGVIPINPHLPDGGPDTGLASLMEGIGAGSVQSLEFRLVGNMGRTINVQTYDLTDPPVFKPGALELAMRDALAKAAAPTHCARQTTTAG